MTADNQESNSDDRKLKGRSIIVGNLSKGTRASTRIRKQRTVQRQEYSEEEADDPFADNSDVDSNYSEHISNSRTNAGKERICGGRNNRNNIKRVKNRRNTRGSVAAIVRKSFRPISARNQRIKHVTEPLHQFNGGAGQTGSIPSLNKNAVTRGTDGTRVGTTSHWLSSDAHFQVGKFVMNRRDKPLLHSTKLILWRIDSKSMLQKYEAFTEEGGAIKFRPVRMYSGWSPLHTDGYALVPVTTVHLANNRKDHCHSIVQIDASETIDIDSDE